MKCDELKVYHCNEWHNEYTEFYIKYDVDAAIDELKSAHHKERHEYIEMVAQLKAKLDDAKASAYAESIDAGMRERRLKRALWMARAEKAKHIANFCYYALHYGRVPVRDIYQCQDKWDKVELKCIKKAEEFK